MDPITRAVLLSWDLRLDVLIVLAILASLFGVGWWRLRRRTGRDRPRKLARFWRLAIYWTGLLFVAISLLSPIDVLAGQLFFMHMIQHLLLIMVVPPLLLLANPFPFILWGLPATWRKRAGRGLSQLLHRESPFRRTLRNVTGPGIVWLLWVIMLVGWHDPSLYDAALRYEWVHDLEHLSFFLASLLFWWHVIGAGPRVHKQAGYLGRIAFVLAAVPPNMALGVVLAFAGYSLYTYYEAVPRLWGIDPVTDQRIGGVIMWIPGSMMFIIAGLVMMFQVLRGEEGKPGTPHRKWSSEEALAAPGLKK